MHFGFPIHKLSVHLAVVYDDIETWLDLTPRGKAQWIRFHHHPIPHIRIQIDPTLEPNRVSGQEASRRGVKVAMCQ